MLKLKFRKIVKTKKITFSGFAKIGHLKIKFYWLSSIPYDIFELPVGSFGLDGFDQSQKPKFRWFELPSFIGVLYVKIIMDMIFK